MSTRKPNPAEIQALATELDRQNVSMAHLLAYIATKEAGQDVFWSLYRMRGYKSLTH